MMPLPSRLGATMWVVVDWHDTKFIGPFASEENAQDWLATKDVLIGQYEDNEVGIYRIEDANQVELKVIEA
jgi:hypothetical protein